MREPEDQKKYQTSDSRRAESFSDGVIAIVITLLTIDLRSPDAPPGELATGLLRQWPTYLAYVTSYLYIAVLWLNHKHAFLRIRRMDRGLHWANLGVLAATALLPFATAVLSRALRERNSADERTAVVLYALVGALLCATWVVFFRYLSHHPSLLADDVPPDFFARETLRATIGFALYCGAGVVGWFIAPALALIIFLCLPIFYGLTSYGLYELSAGLSRRRRKERLS